mgnify:CR=1 FL=1
MMDGDDHRTAIAADTDGNHRAGDAMASSRRPRGTGPRRCGGGTRLTTTTTTSAVFVVLLATSAMMAFATPSSPLIFVSSIVFRYINTCTYIGVTDTQILCRFNYFAIVCRPRHACRVQIGDKLTRRRHVADMSPTFPAKIVWLIVASTHRAAATQVRCSGSPSFTVSRAKKQR